MVGLYAVAVHIFDKVFGQNFRQVLHRAEKYAIKKHQCNAPSKPSTRRI